MFANAANVPNISDILVVIHTIANHEDDGDEECDVVAIVIILQILRILLMHKYTCLDRLSFFLFKEVDHCSHCMTSIVHVLYNKDVLILYNFISNGVDLNLKEKLTLQVYLRCLFPCCSCSCSYLLFGSNTTRQHLPHQSLAFLSF